MKVSLRKANAIQASITEALKSLELETTVTFTEFDKVLPVLDKAKATYNETLARRVNLISAFYSIRKLVGRANVECGISDKLSDAAYMDKIIADLKSTQTAVAHIDVDQIKARLDKIRKSENTNSRLYGIETTAATCVLNHDEQNMIKASILQYKKEKQKLNDQILELNIKTEIELEDKIVETLTSEGLI